MIPIAMRRSRGSIGTREAGEELAALQEAMAALARALVELGRLVQVPPPPDDSIGEAAGVWSDEHYVYVETRLPDHLDAPIDAATCGRTLMVRIARGNPAR